MFRIRLRTLSALLICAAFLYPAQSRRPKVSAAIAPPAKTSPTVKRWLRTMSVRDQVAQLVFIPFYGQAPNTRTGAYRKFVRLV